MPYYRRIRELREDSDKTQTDIAKILGIKQPNYAKYELGQRDMPTETLIKLAQIYKTTTDYILELTNNK